MRDRKPSTARRLVVPVILAVTVITTVVAVTTSVPGCGDDLPDPRVDAAVDGPPDTPIV